MNRFSILLALLVASPLLGADIYVDNHMPCPGSGTSSTPYCSIQNAFNATLNPGDKILIRNGTYNENAVLNNKNGTSSNPISVGPYPGENPTLTYIGNGSQKAVIQLVDSSFITVQNLRFIGTGVWTSWSAVWAYTTGNHGDVQGITVTGCTFKDWGGSEAQGVTGTRTLAFTNGGSGAHPSTIVKNSSITNNTLTGCRADPIKVNGASYITIAGNVITGTVCGKGFDGSVGNTGIHLGSDTAAGYPANNATNISIRDNIVHDSQNPTSCGLISSGSRVAYDWRGIWLDQNVDIGRGNNNTIYNIAPSKTDGAWSGVCSSCFSAVGIETESRCDDWVWRENIIYRIGHTGFQNGSYSTGDPNRTQYINNAVYSTGRYGIDIARGNTLTIKNNAIYAASTAQIRVQATAINQGPHVIDHNGYYDSATQTKVGQWNSGTLSFSPWKTACQGVAGQADCDSHSLNNNPLFVSTTPGSEDFHLRSTSALIGTGDGGVDMGAYPLANSILSSTLPSPTNVTVK